MKRVRLSDAFFGAAEDMDSEAVAGIIQEIHDGEFSPRHYNKEDSLRAVIKLACFTYKDYYSGFEEVGGGRGFADMVFVPRRGLSGRSVLIIELKKDASPEDAIAQIKERGYAKPYENSGFDILFIGISYDSKDPSKKHSCLIEEYEGS